MSYTIITQPWLFQTWQGGTNLTVGNREGTLTLFPSDGNLMLFDSTKQGGFASITPGELVTLAVAQGAILIATGVSLLTAPGQLLTSNGTTNIVVNPPSASGQVLSYDPTGKVLTWVPAESATGDPNPTPNSLAQRTGSGALAAAGFITTGTISAGAANTYNIGTSGVPFAGIYTTTLSVATTATVATSVTTPQVTTASGALTLAPGGATTVTASSTTTASSVPMVAPSFVLGTYQASGSWLITINGSNLSFQSWSGSAYVERSSIAP
jgi:hypothetical protein